VDNSEVHTLKRLGWSILMILPLAASAADVYRSIDANGQVVYSDVPTDQAELVRVTRSVASSQVTAAARAGSSDRQDSSSDEQPEAQIPREATPDEIASDRTRNCQIATERAAAYSVSHRLFRTSADGERVYLSDDETQEARDKAEADVASWCD
jgi:hypothetical protein